MLTGSHWAILVKFKTSETICDVLDISTDIFAARPSLKALSLPPKLGYLKWIFGAKRWEIIDFAVAALKRGYPEVMVGECFGCEFQDGFGIWLR